MRVSITRDRTRKSRIRSITSDIALYSTLTVTALLVVLPLYWMMAMGTLAKDMVFRYPPHLLPGRSLLVSVVELLDRAPYLRAYANSLIVGVSRTVLVLFFSSLAGFAFARYEFPGRDFLFMCLLGTMFVPVWAGIVAWLVVVRALGLVDKLLGLIIPSSVSAMGTFWMRQATDQSVPNELLDAARIDGCGEYRLFFTIVLPIVRPALGALAIMTFIASWNEFLGPLIILQSSENFTLPIILNMLLGSAGTRPTPWGALMAGTALSVTPLLIIFAFASRQFISGLTAGALKG